MGNWPSADRDADHIVFYASSQCWWLVTSFPKEDQETQRLLAEVTADKDQEQQLTAEVVHQTLSSVARIQTRFTLQIACVILFCVAAGTVGQLATANFSGLIAVGMIVAMAAVMVYAFAAERSGCSGLKVKVAATVAKDWGIPPEAVDYRYWKPMGKFRPERVAHVVVNVASLRQRSTQVQKKSSQGP